MDPTLSKLYAFIKKILWWNESFFIATLFVLYHYGDITSVKWPLTIIVIVHHLLNLFNT